MIADIKIGKKLLIGFSLPLIGIIVLLILSFTAIEEINDQLDVVHEDQLPKTIWANNIIDQVNVNASVLRNVFIIQDSLQRIEELKKISTATEIVNKALDSLNAHIIPGEEAEILAKVKEVRIKFVEARANFMNLVNSGNMDAASALILGELDTAHKNYLHILYRMLDYETKHMEMAGFTADDILSSSKTELLIVAGILLAFLITASSIISGNIVKPLNYLNESSLKIASGDLNIKLDIKRKDEIGMLAESFGQMTDNIKKSNDLLVEEKNNITLKVEKAVKESENQKQYLASSIDTILTEMNKFAEGDLTVALKSSKDDEIGKLFYGFSKAVNNINNLIKKVYEAVHATASSSSQISASTEEMAAGSQEQSSQTSEVATAVEQMTKTIIETTRNATAAAENAKNAGSIASEGGNAVKDTIEGMKKIADVVTQAAETVKKLGRSSDQIGEIVQVIDDIADQTNLLALNAAIEAARAGEQGRGFAVVADEVRKLAERTTKATKEIADMIKQIQRDTTDAVASMEKGQSEVESGKQLAVRAGESLNQIIKASDKVVDDITQVASASEEQSATAEQISHSIESITNVTNETSAGIQQVAHAAEDLNRLTDNLQALVSKFRTDNSEETGYAVRQNGKLIKQ